MLTKPLLNFRDLMNTSHFVLGQGLQSLFLLAAFCMEMAMNPNLGTAMSMASRHHGFIFSCYDINIIYNYIIIYIYIHPSIHLSSYQSNPIQANPINLIYLYYKYNIYIHTYTYTYTYTHTHTHIYIYISRKSTVWISCMHLGTHALRLSDHDIYTLLFWPWFATAANLVTDCHGPSRQFPPVPRI